MKGNSPLFSSFKDGSAGVEKTIQKVDTYCYAYYRSLFAKNGHTTIERIRKNADKFINRTISEIVILLENAGYKIRVRSSKYFDSNATILVIENNDKFRNITQVQISPGGGRHGNTPYVKISTTDYGKVKIINGQKENYKSDNNEKTTLIFWKGKK